MSKHRVLSFKPQLLEWRGQDGQNETKQPDHSASLGDSITSSTRIRFSVHTEAEEMFVVEVYAAVRQFVFNEGKSRREAARIFELSRERV
jgi:hypothetical protein